MQAPHISPAVAIDTPVEDERHHERLPAGSHRRTSCHRFEIAAAFAVHDRIGILVIREACAGNLEAANRRLEFLAGMPSLNINEEVMILAIALLDARALPQQAVDDAYHIALAAVHGIDYLLTWNCKHIANATMWSRIDGICRAQDHEPPAIATPEQLQEE
ncbi:MAG: type II toxin-antitoxin system VapC family toxin [Magnetococcales bacterium]|nr:type II toxin-antitoxin system VapC family toxin [Magnetococcales bacterium]